MQVVDVQQVSIPSTSLSMARRSMPASEFEAYKSVRLYSISYQSSGLSIKGWLALPGVVLGKHPAVVFNRGGSGTRGALTDVGAMAFIGRYAAWGYVGIASNYRGVGGSDGLEEWGDGDVDDALATLSILDSLEYVNNDAIGLVGGSRGGMMALMMLARTSRFRAAVTFGAPTTINSEPHKSYIRATMAKHIITGVSEQEQAERLSAVCWADQLCKTTPILVLHGSGDRRVPALHAIRLAEELQRLQHPYKLIVYDNADHVLAGRRDESTQDIRWWLDHYVKDMSPLPRTGLHGA